MTEITVAPEELAKMASAARTQQCKARPEDFEHCTHMTAAPIQGPGSMLFAKACCFCAPDWLKIVILVPHTTSIEQIAALSMQHGNMILFDIAADPAKQIAVSGPVTSIGDRLHNGRQRGKP